jgi:hypothetical protein
MADDLAVQPPSKPRGLSLDWLAVIAGLALAGLAKLGWLAWVSW